MADNKSYKLNCEVRRCGTNNGYYSPGDAGISFSVNPIRDNDISRVYRISLKNSRSVDFCGVILIKAVMPADDPKFFMPGYMYGSNTAEMPSSGRKAFPRLKKAPEGNSESHFFMTRSDRLAEPVSLIYENGTVLGISASPVVANKQDGSFMQFGGFTCNIDDSGGCSVGYTLGYENAPWLFVQTATVRDREPVSEKNSITIAGGCSFEFELTVYWYTGGDERAIYRAITDCYRKYHESPRLIENMDPEKAVRLLSAAIRDYAWLEDEHIYSGFVYDMPSGFVYNRIPSLSWTNGLAVAVPMLLAANRLYDDKGRAQSLTFIDDTVRNSYNPASGLLYESTDSNGHPTVRGWWYNGMHSGGHSGYINGQAIYYLLKAYRSEKDCLGTDHKEWLELAGKVVERVNRELNSDFEYPFSMSENTGAGIEYDSMGGAWCLAASAMYELVSGDRSLLPALLAGEQHYYDCFVKKCICYGGPLDTDKAVDSEGILSYIRAVRLLHEITGNDELLDHLRDALYYEFTFKLGYNTHILVRPLSEIGWSSCGGSITSVANPHIHPMSSTVIDEIGYYLAHREDEYVRSRLNDTIGWSMQTFNTMDAEYGYGRTGWMSERFCFCEGLVVELYPDGEPASTWFALMPWAAASIIEGLVNL